MKHAHIFGMSGEKINQVVNITIKYSIFVFFDINWKLWSSFSSTCVAVLWEIYLYITKFPLCILHTPDTQIEKVNVNKRTAIVAEAFIAAGAELQRSIVGIIH